MRCIIYVMVVKPLTSVGGEGGGVCGGGEGVDDHNVNVRPGLVELRSASPPDDQPIVRVRFDRARRVAVRGARLNLHVQKGAEQTVPSETIGGRSAPPTME